MNSSNRVQILNHGFVWLFSNQYRKIKRCSAKMAHISHFGFVVSYSFAATGSISKCWRSGSIPISHLNSHLWFNTPWSLPEKNTPKKTRDRRAVAKPTYPQVLSRRVRVDFWCVSTKWLRMTSESSAGWGGSTWTVTLQLHVHEIEQLRVSGISCTSIEKYSTSCFQKNGAFIILYPAGHQFKQRVSGHLRLQTSERKGHLNEQILEREIWRPKAPSITHKSWWKYQEGWAL